MVQSVAKAIKSADPRALQTVELNVLYEFLSRRSDMGSDYFPQQHLYLLANLYRDVA